MSIAQYKQRAVALISLLVLLVVLFFGLAMFTLSNGSHTLPLSPATHHVNGGGIAPDFSSHYGH
ncbi:MAG: hypothetical protein M3Y81_19050 [Chloroflexota bacterium]|nr:hypothetical protein [Chloroflexota bacterium]